MKSIKYSSVIFLLVIFVSSAYSQQKENLGLNINSEMDEIHPTLSPDGKTLYFIRSPKKRDSWGQETWYSTLDANGNWERAKKLTDFDDSEIRNVNVQGFSSDGNTMLLGLDYYNTKDVNNRFLISERSGLYMSNKGMKGWEKPNRMDIENLSKHLSQRNGMFLSNNGNVLFQTFSSSHPDDPYNGIFISFLKTNNTWSEPQAIRHISVARYYGSFSPFLASDNRTIYFSGGSSEDVDIYVSTRVDDTWLNWTEPKLIGLNILTEGWESDFIISPTGEYAYFVSDDQTNGGTDIFRCKLDKGSPFRDVGIWSWSFPPSPVEKHFKTIHYKSGFIDNSKYTGLYKGIYSYPTGEAGGTYLENIFPILLINDTCSYLYFGNALIYDFNIVDNVIEFPDDYYFTGTKTVLIDTVLVRRKMEYSFFDLGRT